MTDIKKLSDYTVSDVEKILREELLNHEVVRIWNEMNEHKYPFEYIMYPEDFLVNLDITKARTSIDFNENDRYCYAIPPGIIVSFNNLSDDNSPIDYSEMAESIVEDQTTLRRFLLKLDLMYIGG